MKQTDIFDNSNFKRIVSEKIKAEVVLWERVVDYRFEVKDIIFEIIVDKYTNRYNDRKKLVQASGGENNLLNHLGYQCHHTGRQPDGNLYLQLVLNDIHSKILHICSEILDRK